MAECHHPYENLRPSGVREIAVCGDCRERIVCPHHFHQLVSEGQTVKCNACGATLKWCPLPLIPRVYPLPF